MDSKLRKLERQAAVGDLQAKEKLEAEKLRAGIGPTFFAVASMNYHQVTLGEYSSFEEAKKRVCSEVAKHRVIFGHEDSSTSVTENSASKYPYKVEISTFTAEAGLLKDIYAVQLGEEPCALL